MRESEAADGRWQALALRYAGRGLGRVWPGPANACVVAAGSRLLSVAWEPVRTGTTLIDTALRAAARVGGAPTVHLAWEPSPGIAALDVEAMLAAGVRRCVVAGSPAGDERWGDIVAGAGIAVVRRRDPAATSLNTGFRMRSRTGRPRVTLKVASSLDGRIATATGRSRWITGEPARRRGHLLRARHDAILVGSGTAVADDPDLTCRLPGLESRSPVRVVLDRRLRLPAESRLARTARETPTWVLTAPGHGRERTDPLARRGVTVLPLTDTGIDAALRSLGERGITRLLVEGGAGIAGALLRADRVDEIVWFMAPSALGGDGLAAIGALGLGTPGEALAFRHEDGQEVGADRVLHLTRQRPASRDT